MRFAWLCILVAALVLPEAASATWRRAASPSFIVYSRGSEAGLRAKIQQLQQFDALLHLLTGIPAENGNPPLPVYFVSDRDMRTLGIQDGSVGGFYRASPGGIIAVLDTDRAQGHFGNGVLSVLFHEYTHHFMFQNTRGVYPGWYVEGFAEYLMTADLKPGVVEFGDADPGRVYQLLNRPWLPMRRVLSTRPGDLRGDANISAFYAESWLAVHYLSRDGGRAKALHAYFDALNRGTEPEKAFTAAFGVGYDEFNRQLEAYLRSSKITKSRITGLKPVADAEIAVTVLPPAADTLLVPATQLSQISFAAFRPRPAPLDADKAAAARAAADTKAETDNRADVLATIRREAARFPGDAYAAAVLAEAEVKLGDRAAGVRQLDTLLTGSPNDPQLLYLRAATAIWDARQAPPAEREAALKLARHQLTLANTARPDDFRILAAHASTYPFAAMPEREVQVLLHAADLAPQVAEIQTFAAIALARRGERDSAVKLLSPLANNPHGGPEAQAAAAMIAAIEHGSVIEPATDAP